MLVVLFALSQPTLVLAAENDPSIVEPTFAALEQAATRRDQAIAAAQLTKALGSSTLNLSRLERIATLIALSPNQQADQANIPPSPTLIKLLQTQANNVVLSPRSITLLSESLAGSTIQRTDGATAIAAIIGQQLERQTMPSEALSSLFSALDHPAMSNRAGAVDALSYLPKDHERRSDVVAALVHLLSQSDHYHTRLTAITALTRLHTQAPLKPSVLYSIAKIAWSDAYLTVRLAALEALNQMSTQAPSASHVSSNSNKALIKELLEPSPALWRKSQGTNEHKNFRSRAIAYLSNWYQPNYPPDLVQVLINESRKPSPKQSLDLLRELRLRDALSASQLFTLRGIAAKHRDPKWREAIYQLALPNLVQGSLVTAEQAFASSDNKTTRLEAGHALLRHYANQPVSEKVAGLASDILLTAKDQRLREVAIKLIAQSELPRAAKEQSLLAVVRQGHHERELTDILLSLYDAQDLDEFALLHIGDTRLPVGFKSNLLHRLKDNSTQAMSPALVDALRNAAEESPPSYLLISSIKTAMQARGASVPLIVTLKSKSFQSSVLGIVWMIGLLSAALVGISALIGTFHLPFNGNALGAKRSALAIAWLAGSMLMIGFLASGFVGFVGHNSTPSPSSTLRYNLPLYGALLVYLPLGIFIVRRAWRYRKTTTTH